jgi:hypothetical protein
VNTSGRWLSVLAGSSAMAMDGALNTARVAAASFWRSAGSAIAVSADSTFTSTSHAARWAM